LDHCLGASDDPPTALRLSGALRYFWAGCGALHEGRYWLERALAADPEPSTARLRAQHALGMILAAQGDHPAAVALCREFLDHAHQLGDPVFIARAHAALGLALTLSNELAEAEPELETALAQLD